MSPKLPRATVINLPRHPHRLEHVSRELSSAGVKFDTTKAIDGLELVEDDLSLNATRLGRWFMTPGMVGCFLSHRRCWERCVESGRPLLIFEDDVLLARDFSSRAADALEQLSAETDDWDVLLLGAMGCVHPEGRFGLNMAASLVGGRWRRRRRVSFSVRHDEPCLIHIPLCPYGMHAYVVSPKGASKLLARCPRASYHVDVVAWGYQDLEVYACHPLLARQTHNDTTIGGLHSRWQGLKLPSFTGDSYTGFEFGWAFSAPLLRLGGPYGMILTNGGAICLMLAGLASSVMRQSRTLLLGTLLYVGLIVAIVRLLASQ
mmetsp:Transcript_21350/g.43079  ORF Transcript_21350/g.43079 Transcript_21350/m.43079 type:complete len:318 (-) Transcript_21350:53-1006(-)